MVTARRSFKGEQGLRIRDLREDASWNFAKHQRLLESRISGAGRGAEAVA